MKKLYKFGSLNVSAHSFNITSPILPVSPELVFFRYLLICAIIITNLIIPDVLLKFLINREVDIIFKIWRGNRYRYRKLQASE